MYDPPRANLSGIVLAGGTSRRKGQNKAFLGVGGVPMVRRVLDALAAVCGQVLIVTKTPDVYEHLGVAIVIDQDPRQAALVGLSAGLRAMTTPHAFAASCDLPFLSSDVVAWLASQASGFDAVVPNVEGRWHPLHAVYATQAAAVFEAQRAAGDWRLTTAIERLRVRAATASELEAVDPGLRTLRNINTPAEYRMLISSNPARDGTRDVTLLQGRPSRNRETGQPDAAAVADADDTG
jgi:molybdopterin-guanine dinucleotide biosynthesis protein A